jgi:hypothetical protein
VQLWRAEQVVEISRGYETAEFFPNMFFIGSNGGWEAYGFSLAGSDPRLFEVLFFGLPSDAKPIASSLDSSLGI